jgi:Kdo2-lipid IVA lauroyltransferase/acyltransferase
LAPQKNWLQTRLEYAAALALMYALRRLPLSMANAVARTTTRLLDLALPKLRRVARMNLSFAFPELDPTQRNQIVNGLFRSIARLLVALARFESLNSSNISQWIAYEGLENYLDAKRSGRGVLVATAHLGNWELSAFAHALMTEPMHVMVRRLDNPLIDGFVERRRTQSGNHLIYKQDAARAVLKALRNNEAVGILADQNTMSSEGVFVTFFGKLACAGSVFVKFAYRSQAAVIPGFAIWDESMQRYVLRFYPRVELSGDAQADTQRIHSIFEEIIRQYPDQWMWIHRRWKTRPPGEEPLY